MHKWYRLNAAVSSVVLAAYSVCYPLFRDRRAVFPEAGCLLEGVGELQDAELALVAADYLDADGQAFVGEAAWD